MRRALLSLALLLALPLAAQDGAAYKLDQVAVRLDGGAGGTGAAATYATLTAPVGCVAGSVGLFLGSPVAMGCDAGISYDAATDTLTAGALVVGAKTLTGPSTGVLQLGAADSATHAAVAQTIKAQSNITETDQNAPAAMTIIGPLGTGTGTAGTIVFQTGVRQATGGTAHVPATVLTLSNAGTGGTSAPSAVFAGYVSTTYLNLTSAGLGIYGMASGTPIGLPSGGLITFSSNAARGDVSADTYITRGGAAATLQLGAAASATPVAQTLQTQGSRPGTDSNVAAGALTIQTGPSTGNAVPSSLILSTADPVASGTGAQGKIRSVVLKNTPLAMADATAVTIFTIDLPTQDTGCGVVIMGNYVATDGTDTVSHSGMWTWSFTNDDGTVTGTGVDSAEAINGTGCAAGCETTSVTVAGTVASAKLAFNNTLSVVGTFRPNVLYNSCATMTLN